MDRRYRREKERLEGLFGHLPNFSFFVDGDGKMLPRELYDQTTRHDMPAAYRGGRGVWQHWCAMREIFAAARNEGWSSFLFIEDDVVLTDRFDEVVAAADAQSAGLPLWDILYYGANHSPAVTRELSPNILKVEGSLTTHMVGFRNTVYDDFLDLPTDISDDVRIARELHPKYNCYAIWPSVALQKPGFSVIWNQHTDYTSYFTKKGKSH